jgi:hypothetical protein
MKTRLACSLFWVVSHLYIYADHQSNQVNYAGTYTGHYEPVKEMSDLLDEYEAKTGHSVPIHGEHKSSKSILCVRY